MGLAIWSQTLKEHHGQHIPGLLDQSQVSGTWGTEDHGILLSCTQSAPSAPPRAGHARSLQPNACQAQATHGSQRQAGLTTATTTTALPRLQEPRQPSPTHHPSCTWTQSLPMDATALQSSHKSSMQPMAGVAGCFAINSRENGSSCDSRRVLPIEPGAALAFSVQ